MLSRVARSVGAQLKARQQVPVAARLFSAKKLAGSAHDDDDDGAVRKGKDEDTDDNDVEGFEAPKSKRMNDLAEYDEDEPTDPAPLYGKYKDEGHEFRQLAPAAARKHRYQAIAPKNMAEARRRLLDEYGSRGMSFDDPQFVYDDGLRPDMGLLKEKDKLDEEANAVEGWNFDDENYLDLDAMGLVSQVVFVDTVQKPTTLGNILTFRALVVVGNQDGCAGYAVGRGSKIDQAIDRATLRAIENFTYVDRFDDRTLYHEVNGKFNSCELFIRPSKVGQGTTVSDTVGCALYCFGITDVVSKCRGQRNPYTVIKATFDALSKHETAEEIALKTGHSVVEITNLAKYRKL
ncbi:hypothetical protein H310_13757 [Aphanomyces invadans]|uniref:S5 DRBM domain-containing protein n=1 Tax=Aphanomyces invadans TaxID=157072 RepID=A0A024TDK9_9STRA|nr:hypothetical protein H310_13757 [Aphanomyces invadans]ETV91681.1 hypothetical protein H310_13757 [Aphanomyces invadans]|eukprot:XP_008879607.1 hypothetical protein H310_13757 [Aphanomyces invadans]